MRPVRISCYGSGGGGRDSGGGGKRASPSEGEQQMAAAGGSGLQGSGGARPLRPGELRRPRCPGGTGRDRSGWRWSCPGGPWRGAGCPRPGTETGVQGSRGRGGFRATQRSVRGTVATSEPAQKCRDLLQQAGTGYCVSVGTAGSSLVFLASYTF